MAGGVGHTGGLTNPRPWRGRCRAGYSYTGGPPLPQKRAPYQKKVAVWKMSIIAWLQTFACKYGNNSADNNNNKNDN